MQTRRILLALALAVTTLAALAPGAGARELYVANYDTDSLAVIDAATNQVVGGVPTGADSGPWMTAVTPDGRTAYTVGWDSGELIGVDTATKQVSGPSVPISTNSWGIAITPDGTRAYIAGGGAVTAIDLQARQVIGAPIPVCASPSSVIITPDGTRAYVPCADAVRVLDLGTNQVVGAPIEPSPGGYPFSGAVTPDGKLVFIADLEGSVMVIDTATNQATSIPTGGDPQSIAISPDGRTAYVADYENDLIMIIDVATRQVVNPAVAGPGFKELEFIAVSPDGTKVFASQPRLDSVVGLATAGTQPFGPIAIGGEVGGPAFVPDQSPVAALALPTRVRPGVAATFGGTGSTDPDGTVAGYAWQFGDGGSASGPAGTTSHTYGSPGTYTVGLTVTDNEGCSVPMVFTGQTASCHGSPAATTSQTLEVSYPGVKVRCPMKAGAKGCKFKLKVVKRTGKGKKRKLKAQSAVARAKLKAGRTAVVSLVPKKAVAAKLAGAGKLLVSQQTTIGGRSTTKVKKLKVVE